MMFDKMKDVWAREGTGRHNSDQQLRAQGANMDELFNRRQMEHKQMMDQIQQMEWARQRNDFN